jgi:hypothetical protein
MVDGLQVPAIPFVESNGNVGAGAPLQIERLEPKLNEGVSIGFTVTVNVAVVAHKPDVGVNV